MLFDLLLGALHWVVIDPLVGLVFGLILIPLALPFRFFRATSTPLIAVGLPGLACFGSGLYLYWQHELADMEHIQHLIFVYWIAGMLASILYLRRDARRWESGLSKHAVSILQSVSLVPMALIALFAGLRFVSPAFTDEKALIYSWPFGVKAIVAFLLFGFASSAAQQLLYWPTYMALSAAGGFIENGRWDDQGGIAIAGARAEAGRDEKREEDHMPRVATSAIAYSAAIGASLVLPANASPSASTRRADDLVQAFLATKNPEDPEVQYQVAVLYSGVTNVLAQDYAQMAKWLLKSAKQGHAKAQAHLGEAYAEGHGVREDHAEAAKWYRKAAEQGNGLGELGLAQELTFGVGVARDEAQAVSWLRKAAQNDSPEGVSRAAQSFLGAAYYFGKGVPQSYGEAIPWLRKAGAQGDALAQGLLGEAYFKGRGVSQDTATGLSWYRKSAEQGNSSAQRSMAYMYADGLGIAPDSIEGYKWIILAKLHANNEQERSDLASDAERFAQGMTATQLATARQRSDQWERDFRRARRNPR